jgi:hypothetical protein
MNTWVFSTALVLRIHNKQQKMSIWNYVTRRGMIKSKTSFTLGHTHCENVTGDWEPGSVMWGHSVGLSHNEVCPVSLVMDLRITHDRFDSNSDPSLNGHLHYPVYMTLHTSPSIHSLSSTPPLQESDSFPVLFLQRFDQMTLSLTHVTSFVYIYGFTVTFCLLWRDKTRSK